MRLLRDEPLSHDNVFHTLLGLFEVESGVYDGRKDLLQRARDLAGATGSVAGRPSVSQ